MWKIVSYRIEQMGKSDQSKLIYWTLFMYNKREEQLCFFEIFTSENYSSFLNNIQWVSIIIFNNYLII